MSVLSKNIKPIRRLLLQMCCCFSACCSDSKVRDALIVCQDTQSEERIKGTSIIVGNLIFQRSLELVQAACCLVYGRYKHATWRSDNKLRLALQGLKFRDVLTS